jgi:hydrogenase nickel incorporation protein HypA/HybF
MHELSVTQSVVETITERTGGEPVSVVHLQIGKLSGVVPDSVRFCFELIVADTPLQDARLEIDEPVGRAHCDSCGLDFELEVLLPLCPCGSANVRVLAGEELTIRSVELV